MFEGLRFQDPIWITLVFPVALLFFWAERRRRRYAVLFSSLEGLRGLPVTWAQRVKRLLPFLYFLGVSLLIMALARPQLGRHEFRIRTEGIAIQLALDRSGSMQAMDFLQDDERVRRVDVVKRVVRDFVAGGGELPGRPDDLLGLVVFGGFAESRCPLTLDHGALLEVLKTVDVPQPIRDRQGRVLNAELLEEEQRTAIGDALALAVRRLEDTVAKSKVVILLSDGESNAGVVEPMAAAEAAKTLGIKAYTIGVGTTGTAPFPLVDPFGQTRLVPQEVRLDEEALRKIADLTGGRYFNARDTRTLEEVYATIDALEKTETEGRLYTEYEELYAQALLPGLLLVLATLVLTSTRFRRLP
ncbi:MAG: VWA domain-containing protein [Planctomycetota bacterium]